MKKSNTERLYNEVIDICQDIFTKKMSDYGASWRLMRPESITDQIYIKAQRIKSLETKDKQMVAEGKTPEYIAIINYAIMGIIQLDYYDKFLTNEQISAYYKTYFDQAKQLMIAKNHDYDEVWRSMRISSYTDLILMKIMRTKQIEDNYGKTKISEGIDANYYDILNYSVFAMIRLVIENIKLHRFDTTNEHLEFTPCRMILNALDASKVISELNENEITCIVPNSVSDKLLSPDNHDIYLAAHRKHTCVIYENRKDYDKATKNLMKSSISDLYRMLKIHNTE